MAKFSRDGARFARVRLFNPLSLVVPFHAPRSCPSLPPRLPDFKSYYSVSLMSNKSANLIPFYVTSATHYVHVSILFRCNFFCWKHRHTAFCTNIFLDLSRYNFFCYNELRMFNIAAKFFTF